MMVNLNQSLEHLGEALWRVAEQHRGTMNMYDSRDYMLGILFLRHLSDNYERAAQSELGREYPGPDSLGNGRLSPLSVWYEQHPGDVEAFEQQMRRKTRYIIRPEHLWASIEHMARNKDDELLNTLRAGFKCIENESFQGMFSGIFSEVNLDYHKLGENYSVRNARLCSIVAQIGETLAGFSIDGDTLGDAFDYLVGQFASRSRWSNVRKAVEFHTQQQISDILSGIVTLDSQAPAAGMRTHVDSVLDFACGSGSLLLNVRQRMGPHGIGKIYGQEKNIANYNLARMNMLVHGVKDSAFEIYHGDTLRNDWDMLRETGPARMPRFDAVVANPPATLRLEKGGVTFEDARFKDYYGGLGYSTADMPFLLHGLHCLKDDGVMAIILHPGALIRGGGDKQTRRKLLDDRHIDAVIRLPANVFYLHGSPGCVFVLKKGRQLDDVLFIDAFMDFEKGKRMNRLSDEHVRKIIDTYRERPENIEGYARRVGMDEIAANDYNLSISRYVDIGQERTRRPSATQDETVEVEQALMPALSPSLR